MKIKRNNKSMTIDVSNGKLQKKFATGGHLYEFGTEDFSLKPTSSNINLSEGTQPTTTTTPNGLHYSNAIDLSVATKGNNSTTPNGLPNGAGSMDLGKGKETTPSTPSKNISASNALSGVSGIMQAGVEGYGKNAQINDMSTTKTEARDLGSKPTNDSSFQSLNQNVADTKLMNGVSFRDVRGGSDGQRFMNTLGSTVNGAASGASMGPYGALAGAVIGLGSGVAGWIAGGSKARREQRRVNNLINHANEEYTTNAANQVYNIQNQTMANQGRNYFAQGGHMFAGGTGLPSYPYLSVPQRQWSYSTPHVDYAGRISSFNPYNTGLVDPETGAYQLKPVVIKAKPEPMAARISANAQEEKKAAEQARLEAEEVARVKKNHPMTDSDYDQSSIFNQPTQHPYLYSIAHDGGYSPSQNWQGAKYGMAAALAAPAAIAGAGAIGAAGGIGNVLNAPTIIGGRIASAAGLPAYYGSTAVDAAFAAHGANALKDLAVKKYNGQSLNANDYANAALAGLEMAPAAPAIVNGMRMMKVPRYLSTDPDYALAAQTPSGQTVYVKPEQLSNFSQMNFGKNILGGLSSKKKAIGKAIRFEENDIHGDVNDKDLDQPTLAGDADSQINQSNQPLFTNLKNEYGAPARRFLHKAFIEWPNRTLLGNAAGFYDHHVIIPKFRGFENQLQYDLGKHPEYFTLNLNGESIPLKKYLDDNDISLVDKTWDDIKSLLKQGASADAEKADAAAEGAKDGEKAAEAANQKVFISTPTNEQNTNFDIDDLGKADKLTSEDVLRYKKGSEPTDYYRNLAVYNSDMKPYNYGLNASTLGKGARLIQPAIESAAINYALNGGIDTPMSSKKTSFYNTFLEAYPLLRNVGLPIFRLNPYTYLLDAGVAASLAYNKYHQSEEPAVSATAKSLKDLDYQGMDTTYTAPAKADDNSASANADSSDTDQMEKDGSGL